MARLVGGAMLAAKAARLQVMPVRVELPLGYVAAFFWRDGEMKVAFEPRMPSRVADARLGFSPTFERLMRAYRDARRDFLQGVANAVGEPVRVRDKSGDTVIRPNRVH